MVDRVTLAVMSFPMSRLQVDQCWQVLEERAAASPQGCAFRFLDGTGTERGALSYAALLDQSQQLSARIRAMAKPGNRALVLLPPGLPYVTAIFACFHAGVVAVPAYPPRGRRDDPRIARIQQDCGAALSIVPVDSSDPEAIGLGIGLTAHGDASPASAIASPDHLALIQYTSGSTGEPRGVMLSHAQLLHNAHLVQQAAPHRAGERSVFWLPPYHDMGLMGGILQPVYAGLEAILMAPATFLQRPMAWLEAMSRYEAVSTAAPDFAYRACVERSTADERAALDLSAWRIAFNGAEPLRAETMTRFVEAFASAKLRRTVFVPSYGLAESTLFVTGGPVDVPPVTIRVDRDRFAHGHLITSDASDAPTLTGSGCIPDDTVVRVVHPERGIACDPSEIGELWVQARNVGLGYWNQEEATAQTFGAMLPDGSGPYLRTGDLGAIMNGQLFVTGRLKDLLIVDGRNVYPQDIERALDGAHVSIRSDACVAFQCDDGRTVALAEVARQTTSDVIGTIRSAMQRAVADACGIRPDVVACVRALGLPRTSSGKLRRRAAREAWLAGTLPLIDAPTTPAATQSTLAWLVSWIAKDRGMSVDQIDASRSLFDTGLDSMALVRLQAAIEAAFTRRIEDRTMFEITSVAALAAVIDSTVEPAVRSAGVAQNVPLPQPRRFADWPEIRALAERRHAMGDVGLADPFFPLIEPRDGATVRNARGQLLLNFAGYDYLGLAADPRVREAAAQAIGRFGTSSSASRLVSGERSVHRALESALARFCGTEDAITLVGGHATNVSVLSHLAGSGDLICCDERVHNSLWVGARQSGARVLVFRHNDANDLRALLAAHAASHRRTWVCIESVYSADGDSPDLRAFVDAAHAHDALLFVDEAHGHGVLGRTGHGIAEAQGVDPASVDVWMGTLSKAFASAGGFIAAPRVLIEYLRYSCPGFVFSAGMPPASAAAALAAIELLEAEPERVTTLRARSMQFRQRCAEAGIGVGESGVGSAIDTPIIPIITGSPERTVALAAQLESRGVLAAPMLPPAVPEGAARVRFFVTASHTEAQIEAAVRVLAEAIGAAESLGN